MSNKLLKAAIDGNEADLKELLGLNDDEEDHHPHTRVSVEDVAQMELSDCLRSIASMEDTILHILSAYGHKNLVSAICLKDSSLLKTRNVLDETPFHHAARFGHDDTILNLIENAKSEFGEAGLKELLRQKNCLGETALHEAARHGHGAVVSALMEEDLELAGSVNDDYASPLYLATARGLLDMADETKRAPLHFIASTGNHKIAELLLDKDSLLPYIPDLDGSYPVHTAVRMGHVKMIVLLLQRCLDSGQLLDSNRRNFLHIAIEAKKSGLIFKLLKDSKNKLPISHWKKMLNRMANTMDNKGNTPLHLAADHGIIGYMLARLKNNELDLTLQNKKGLTALDMSVIQHRKSSIITQHKDILGEFYVRNMRVHISTGWFLYYTKDQMSETELIRGTIQGPISTTDTRGAKQRSESVLDKAQLAGLGSVLIATVTFSAAFTLPGGTNQDTGNPILAGRYLFKAFILADFAEFFFSFLATMMLIYSSTDGNADKMEIFVARSMKIFTIAAKCMVMALALGLSLVLAPNGAITAFVICVFTFYLFFFDNPYILWHRLKGLILEKLLLKHIPDGASGQNRVVKDISYFTYEFYKPTVVPCILIFVLALF